MAERVYDFECSRSNLYKDQVSGVKCTLASTKGMGNFANGKEALDFAISCCTVPGIWDVHVRCGQRRMKPRTIKVEYAR